MKIKALLLILLSLPVFLFFSSKDKKIRIESAPYDSIILDGSYSVTLVEGKEGEIIMEGSEKAIENTKVYCKNGVLEFEQKKHLNNSIIDVQITVESINNLEVRGSADVKSTLPIKTEKFSCAISGSGNIELETYSKEGSFDISGSGNYTLKGNTENLDLEISGSGNIDALSLNSKNVKCSISGSGDIEVNAQETLNVKVSGSGDVKYTGIPQVNLNVSGSGKVRKIE